jgi:23S rRNA pseudouridine1911/1915/1917 synthase
MKKISSQVRLHKLISTLGTSYNNPQIQKNINTLGVYVNGKLETNRLLWVYAKTLGDDLSGSDINIDHWPTKTMVPYSLIEKCFENQDYYIFYKPFGLPVQSGTGHLEHNFVNYLSENFEEQKAMTDEKKGDESSNISITAGLAHRLDKDTEGLILVAKSVNSHLEAQNCFRDREVKKEYLTVLMGKLESEYDVKGFQVRDPANPVRQKFFLTNLDKEDSELRFSNSIFTPLLYCPEKNLTFTKVEIKTGRMHQIRLHAQTLGYPLFQDTVYNNLNLKISDSEIENFKSQNEKLKILEISHEELQEKLISIFKTHAIDIKSFYLKSNKIEIPKIGISTSLLF